MSQNRSQNHSQNQSQNRRKQLNPSRHPSYLVGKKHRPTPYIIARMKGIVEEAQWVAKHARGPCATITESDLKVVYAIKGKGK